MEFKRFKNIDLKYYFKSEQLTLLFLILLSAVLIVLSIEPGHNWGDDFALYIQQAAAILDGSLEQLYNVNKFSMQNSSWIVGPYLYPNGFPLILAPVYYGFGLNFVVLKVYCSLFSILTFPLIYTIFKPYFSQPVYILLLIMLIALNPFFIKFSDNILSDFPFLFITFLVFVLIRSKTNIWTQITIGFLIFYAYYIRTIGIVLLPTLFIYQVNSFIKLKKFSLLYFIPYGAFLSFLLVFKWLFPSDSGGYLELMFNFLTWESIIRNVIIYTSLIGFFFSGIKSIFIGILILVVSFYGVTCYWNKTLHFVGYLFGVLIILILWPFTPDMRFLFPVLPFMIFYLIKGAISIMGWMRIRQLIISRILIGLIVIFSILNIGFITITTVNRDTNQAYNEEMKNIYSYLKSNVSDDQIVAFRKPRALRLFTGLNSIRTNPAHFESSVADYFLTSKQRVDSGIIKQYMTALETESYLLLKKQN